MKRVLVAALLVALAAAFFVLDLDRFLSLAFVKSQQAAVTDYYHAHPVRSMVVFFLFYVCITALSLPGATALTLAGGAIFGLALGTLLVSFASSIGALAAFLVVRFLARDVVQRRFGAKLRAVNAGMARDGAFYLFALRLVPAVPFFVVNLAMPLTPIRPWTFYWVSQIGMLAGTLVYVNAGTQLARIEAIGDVLSAPLIASFALLAVFPFLARAALDALRTRKRLAPYPKPARFERNLIVIGAGAAGLVCAYIAATVKAKVTLVERSRMGGDCLNTGCIPSKTLIRSANLLSQIRRAREFGVADANATHEFTDMMARVRRVIAKVAPNDSIERYTALGVECIQGEATITSPYRVDIRTAGGVRSLTARAIVIATGANPIVPPLAGFDTSSCLTSETVWDMQELPRRMLVLGGGPVGCELAQCFARLGSQVTLVEMQSRVLFREDPEVSSLITERFVQEGIRVLTNHAAKRVVRRDGAAAVVCTHEGEEVRIECDQVLCALGRKPRTENLGLEALGIGLTRTGAVEVDDYGRTRIPTIFACGDVTGGLQFTHTAAHAAWYATVNALFGSLCRFRIDTRAIAWCTFTDPEVARAGLSETEAIERGIAHEITRYHLDELDRALTDEAAVGFVKVITVPGKDRILGVTIVAEHAGELIAEYVLAMKHDIGLNRILGTMHVYPTFAEANKYAAGQWRKAHAPKRLLHLVERFHAWKRA